MKSKLVLAVIFIIIMGSILSLQQTKMASHVSGAMAEHFSYIVDNANSACYGMEAVIAMPDDGRIMGSCCGPMNLHAYEEQVKALKKYSYVDKIPADPYDISVTQAKDMINDFKTVQLSSKQQQTYEDAKKLSNEGGPCCCGDDFSETSCWRWKVYGGLAKYLITKHNFNAEQVANVWDISDGCGGDHHVEGVHN